MSHEKKKATAVESAKAWLAKHSAEVDLKALHAAITAVEKKTQAAQAAATQLGEILVARKEAVKMLKQAVKDAKAARKTVPVKPATVATKARSTRPAAKKAAPKKAAGPEAK